MCFVKAQEGFSHGIFFWVLYAVAGQSLHLLRCMHTYIHTSIHPYLRTCVHVYMHPYIHTCVHAYMYTCIHIFIFTYVQPDHTIPGYVHAHMHASIYVAPTMCPYPSAVCVVPGVWGTTETSQDTRHQHQAWTAAKQNGATLTVLYSRSSYMKQALKTP